MTQFLWVKTYLLILCHCPLYGKHQSAHWAWFCPQSLTAWRCRHTDRQRHCTPLKTVINIVLKWRHCIQLTTLVTGTEYRISEHSMPWSYSHTTDTESEAFMKMYSESVTVHTWTLRLSEALYTKCSNTHTHTHAVTHLYCIVSQYHPACHSSKLKYIYYLLLFIII